MINYYFTDDDEVDMCDTFAWVISHYEDEIRFFQPSPIKAPWHVQAVLGEIELNFWPHKMKGQRRPLPAVEGAQALFALLQEALHDYHNEDDLQVVE